MQKTLLRVALLSVFTMTSPMAAWAADDAKAPVGAAASAPKAKAARKQSQGAHDCPKGTDEQTGSTGLSNKGETGTQGGSVIGPKKPKCPQDMSGKVATQAK